MTDVLVITAPVPGAYPSTNHLGRDGYRGGRKSVEYRDLFNAVKVNAQEEIARTGWVTASYFCAVSATLYRNSRRKIDSGNLMKVEGDALTAARVWEDDDLARPSVFDLEFDPDGEQRVVIVVRRRFPDLHASSTERQRKSAFARPRKFVGATLGEPMGEINGKPVLRSQMLADLRKRGF